MLFALWRWVPGIALQRTGQGNFFRIAFYRLLFLLEGMGLPPCRMNFYLQDVRLSNFFRIRRNRIRVFRVLLCAHAYCMGCNVLLNDRPNDFSSFFYGRNVRCQGHHFVFTLLLLRYDRPRATVMALKNGFRRAFVVELYGVVITLPRVSVNARRRNFLVVTLCVRRREVICPNRIVLSRL